MLSLSPIFLVNSSYSKDITNLVIRETLLDEHVSSFCAIYCVGNERTGVLKSVIITPDDEKTYKVDGKATLRNKQVTGEPLNMTLFDRTIIVNSKGTLNSESCELKVDDVVVENDFQNIVTNLLKSNSDVIGKVIEVPDCGKFLN